MTAVVPTRIVAEWLNTQLTGSADLLAAAPNGVWEDHLPEGRNLFPGVVFQYQSGSDLYATGGFIVLTDCLYVVKAIDKSANYAQAETVAGLIHAAIQRKAGELVSGSTLFCERVSPVQYPETVEGGVEFKHLGGLYHIWAR